MTEHLVEYRVGPAVELPVGEGRAYAAGGDMVAVFRLRDGSLRAVSATCPHAGGPIADGLADAEVVICPLHQHTFDLTTGCSKTGQPPLTVYTVRVDGEGELVIGRSPPARQTELPGDGQPDHRQEQSGDGTAEQSRLTPRAAAWNR